MAVILYVKARKFFWDQLDCSRKIFMERKANWWTSYSRYTGRVEEVHQLAFSLRTKAASGLSCDYGVSVDSDTFLVFFRKEGILPTESPVVIVIDDWAFKKDCGTTVLSGI